MHIKRFPVAIRSALENRMAIALFAFATSLVFCQNVLAQNSPVHPTARLMKTAVDNVEYSRPRRVTIETSGTTTFERNASPSIEDATDIERRAFEQTNHARIANGREALLWDPELCRMARQHSEAMARQGFFDHQTPDGFELKARARTSGIGRFRVIGENIAYNKGYEDPGAFAVQRWMMSPGHRANILYGEFQASAIGSYVASDGSVYLTQIFISR